MLRPPRPALRYRTLLRYGAWPLLACADIGAGVVANFVVGTSLAAGARLIILLVAMLSAAGLYRSRLELSVLDDLPRLASRPVAAGAVLALGTAVVHPNRPIPSTLVESTALFVPMLLVGRALSYTLVRRCRAVGMVHHPTLILGAGRVGGHVASTLLLHPEYGLKPVGFLDTAPLLTDRERELPLLGAPEDLARVLVEFGVRDVVVAFSSLPESAMVEIIRTCDRLSVEIFLVPRLYELHRRGRDTDEVWGMSLIRLRRAAFRSPGWRFKRLLDVCLSALGLIALSPVFGAIALAIRLEGKGPVLFHQERVGLDHQPIEVLKFRTLTPQDDTESRTRWNVANDHRVTRLGRFLRRSSLDELPQLWNVLRGDMSLVGPRPERPHFAADFARIYPRYSARHRVPVGVTGWAQVHGLRGDTSIEDRARFDNHYIENWSLWYDLKILLRTIGSVVRSPGG